jgi:hypothetical protein
LGIDNEERFFKAAERGHVFENMVVMEAIKRLSHKPERAQIYFYRTAAGAEVDLVVERKNKIEAYEIKLSKTPNKEMAVPLAIFVKDHKVDRSALVSLYEKKIQLTDKIHTEHWSQILA